MEKTIRIIVVALCVLLLCSAPSQVAAHPLRAPAPSVTSISPNQAYNFQATTITISGTNLVATRTTFAC